MEASLRLYWLLTIDPTLDTTRPSWAWLVAGMRQTGISGRLLEVFCQALEYDIALADPCGELLRQEAPYGALRRLCFWRWKRAVAAGTWRLIIEDLDQLRNRLRQVPAGMWVGLLFQAIDFLAFCDDQQGLRSAGHLLAEIGGFPELELSMEGEHHRAENVLVLAAEREVITTPSGAIQQFGEINDRIMNLVPELWTGPAIEQRQALMALCARITENPRNALRDLDVFCLRIGPRHLRYLSEVLQRLPRPGADPTAAIDDPARNRINKFLAYDLTNIQTEDRHDRKVADAQIRIALLAFCLEEWISPTDFANSLEANPAYLQGWEGFPGTIRADASLQLIWSAFLALGVGPTGRTNSTATRVAVSE